MKTDHGVELITTREAYIRHVLAKSYYLQTFTVGGCIKSASEWNLSLDDLPSIVEELNSRRADADQKARLNYHVEHPKAEASNTENTTPDPCLQIAPPRSIFYDLLEIFGGFIALVGSILAMTAFVAPYILLADLLGSWILSILAGSVFWIVIACTLASIPWIKLKPSHNWIFAPIRYLRTLFRRLEKATRPPENC